MINHKYKIIFIHIPRTGGTSIEKAIGGVDWWSVHPPSKHLTAYIAKKVYAEHWDDYFKFTFIRNPWDRMVSLLKYGSFYGVSFNFKEKINIDKYINDYSKIEYDKRFFHLNQFKDFIPKKNSIYQNIIGEEMDFIGKFESLEEDFNYICDKIKLPQKKLPHLEASQRRCYRDYYYNKSKLLVENKYSKDIEKFKYEF